MEKVYQQLDPTIRKISELTTLCKTYGIGTTQCNEPDNYRSFVLTISQDGGKTFAPFGNIKNFDLTDKKYIEFNIGCSIIYRLYCQKILTNKIELNYVEKYQFEKNLYPIMDGIPPCKVNATHDKSYIIAENRGRRDSETIFECYNEPTKEWFKLYEKYWFRDNEGS
jgi:hypothetical protein